METLMTKERSLTVVQQQVEAMMKRLHESEQAIER
jgi:hypothetical protein